MWIHSPLYVAKKKDEQMRFVDSSGSTAVCTGTSGCPPEHSCSPVSVGLSSVNYCCPTRSYICKLPPVEGQACGTAVTRYAYSLALGTCSSFTYLGCAGNANSFVALANCERYCKSNGCPATLSFTPSLTSELCPCSLFGRRGGRDGWDGEPSQVQPQYGCWAFEKFTSFGAHQTERLG